MTIMRSYLSLLNLRNTRRSENAMRKALGFFLLSRIPY
jgi:hypothetical protein